MVSSFTHMRTWGGGWIYHDYTALAAYSPTEDIKKALLAESMAQMRILDLKRDTWVKREKAIWDLEDLRDLHRSQGIDFIRLRAEYELSAIAQAERIASERASERASELASKPRSRLRMPWLPQLPKVNRKLGGKRIVQVHVVPDVERIEILDGLRAIKGTGDWGDWVDPCDAAKAFAAEHGEKSYATVYHALREYRP